MSGTRDTLVLTVLAAVALNTIRAAGQDSASSGRLCLNHPQPRPVCSAIALTNFGAYYRTGGNGESHLRLIADWGLLMTTGRRSAIGGSLFLSAESRGFTLGPAIRYQHWSADAKSSWEVAIGVPLNNGPTLAHGLVKWNVSRLVGLSIRPELRRTYDAVCSGPPYVCNASEHRGPVVSFGVEIGGVPGIALTAASFVGLVAAALAYPGN